MDRPRPSEGDIFGIVSGDRPEFEFDVKKSDTNRAKHGIDFVDAQRLWDDVDRIEVPPRRQVGEARMLVTGRIADRYWTAVVTKRRGCVRIISVRRARKEEVRGYEQEGR